MSRKGNNKKQYEAKVWEHDNRYKSNHYTRLYDSQLYSPAWLALPHTAKWQYMILRSQYRGGMKQTDGNGNAMIKCPYSDIVEAGIGSNATISKNFALLEALGFIKIIGGGLHVANQYKLSSEWHNITSKKAEMIVEELKNQTLKKVTENI